MTTPDISSESKAYPGHKPRERGRQPLKWFAPWKRDLSMWGFALNRAAGIGLVVYLILHMVVLSLLLRGESGWNQFVALAKHPLFLLLDVILIAGIAGHGLNGLRVALVGTGLLVKQQRVFFIILMVIAITLLVIGGVLVFVH
jgi:succinate dehydrogenase / fumarate reductase cytochrome b subunit